MESKLLAVIDAGTTGTRCTIYDNNLNTIGYHYVRNRNFYPFPGWVEQDPESIYKNAIIVFNKAVKNAKIDKDNIREIGITNQRETIIGWDRNTGIPIYNAIVWQDNRTADLSKTMMASGMGDSIRDKTGLLINPYFSALKIKWIIENKGLRKRELNNIIFGTVDSWLIWKFSNGRSFISDYSNSSRTMLMNLKTLDWDDELLSYFQLEENNLPLISPSFGHLNTFAERLGNIQITSILGDQQSAMIGEGCFDYGNTKITLGTGSFILQNIGSNNNIRKDGILTTVAYGTSRSKVNFALEGSTQISGGIIDWLIKNRIVRSIEEANRILKEEKDKKWNEDIYFVPSFSGLYSPYWDSTSRGLIVGISNNTNKRSMVMAAYEAVIFQIMDILDSMNNAEGFLRINGGLSQNHTLMQLLSNYIGREISVSINPEITSYGTAIAMISGMKGPNTDLYNNYSLKRNIFKPEKSNVELRYKKWKEAVQRSMGWTNMKQKL
ncbi:MAG: FGGY family carbohydrate kinase [Thermoplasmata archaeon]